MSLSPKGSILAIGLDTGEVFLTDTVNSYRVVESLETPIDNYSLNNDNKLFKGVSLIQDELERSNLFENFSRGAQALTSDAQSPIASKINRKKIQYPKYFIKTEIAFKSITIHNSNTLRLQQIYKDDSTISKSVKVNYSIEGRCNGFQVHPSNEYLLILSNIGFLYVFKLINGELRLKIGVPSLSKALSIDPSGLYAIIAANINNEETKNLGLIKAQRSNLGILMSSGNENLVIEKEIDCMYKKSHAQDRSKVLLIEIGTGNVIGCVNHIFDITTSGVSSDGKFFSLGSKKGHVGVWTLFDDYYENISNLLLEMRLNPKVWSDYPIIQDIKNLQAYGGQNPGNAEDDSWRGNNQNMSDYSNNITDHGGGEKSPRGIGQTGNHKNRKINSAISQ